MEFNYMSIAVASLIGFFSALVIRMIMDKKCDGINMNKLREINNHIKNSKLEIKHYKDKLVKEKEEDLKSTTDKNKQKLKFLSFELKNSIPEGTYTANLVSMSPEVSKTSKRPQINSLFIITEGDRKGFMIRKYSGLETESNIDFLARDIDTLGYEFPGDPADLPDLCNEISQEPILCEIQIVKNGENTNIRLLKCLESTGPNKVHLMKSLKKSLML